MYGASIKWWKLVVIAKNTAIDTKEYLRVLTEGDSTVLNQIPTPFYSLMNLELENEFADLNLRYVIFGGETLKPEKLKDWKMKYPNTKLINMYGITETTVHVTYKEVTEKEIESGVSNIGYPIPTLMTYIMDRNNKIVPIGVIGEISVYGDGVARGYLNRERINRREIYRNPYE